MVVVVVEVEWCLGCGVWVAVVVVEVEGDVGSGRDGVVSPDPGPRPLLAWPSPMLPGLSSSEWIMSGASIGW